MLWLDSRHRVTFLTASSLDLLLCGSVTPCPASCHFLISCTWLSQRQHHLIGWCTTHCFLKTLFQPVNTCPILIWIDACSNHSSSTQKLTYFLSTITQSRSKLMDFRIHSLPVPPSESITWVMRRIRQGTWNPKSSHWLIHLINGSSFSVRYVTSWKGLGLSGE